ncbi:hypothetical protein CEV31_0599 [Brucella thiophenivorans]|uniref:Uncharacterized protein n=1 Tax=Brucella thiophenivorans TaxID=571255 RepID=A0A256G453_9HYPH|nr:hypothetical protein CEV31_0599 [Brucella thiophenivorans]
MVAQMRTIKASDRVFHIREGVRECYMQCYIITSAPITFLPALPA